MRWLVAAVAACIVFCLVSFGTLLPLTSATGTQYLFAWPGLLKLTTAAAAVTATLTGLYFLVIRHARRLGTENLESSQVRPLAGAARGARRHGGRRAAGRPGCRRALRGLRLLPVRLAMVVVRRGGRLGGKPRGCDRRRTDRARHWRNPALVTCRTAPVPGRPLVRRCRAVRDRLDALLALRSGTAW